jgi:predicted nucleic acid-binding protein
MAAGAVFYRYWDASALVKVIATDPDEAGNQPEVEAYFHQNRLHNVTSYCLAEALSAFKSKWLRKRITQDEYMRDVREFFRLVVPFVTEVPVPLAGPIRTSAERHMQAYRLDFIDAIQLATVRFGRESIFVAGSQTLFITADHDLAVAAHREGARVWECTRPFPQGPDV